MQPITSVVTTPARPAAAAAGVREPSDVQRADEQQEQKKRPAVDEYIPGEEREPSGCYWPGRDENGEPKEVPIPIPFDISLCTIILWEV